MDGDGLGLREQLIQGRDTLATLGELLQVRVEDADDRPEWLKHLDEALAFINARDRPLALYLFDRDRRRIARVLDETIAGGVTVNDTILHIAQDELPFGGVGPSGMGHYHGRTGFDTFSKLKPVFHQSRLNAMALFDPPYGALFERLLKILLR